MSITAKKKNYGIFNRINLEKVKGGFVLKVYSHLFISVVILVLLEILLFKTGIAEKVYNLISGIPWLAILGAFMIIAWLARHAAYKFASLQLQYTGLVAYIIAKAFILIPLLYHSEKLAPEIINYAAQFTLAGFTILTFIVFFTRKDFSFLRSFLIYAGFIALGTIIFGFIFNLTLGIWFDIAMILIGGGSILYDTSKVVHNYNNSRYVGAALELFASITLVFWYSLRLFRRFPR